MSEYLYSNQFKKTPVIGDSVLGINPNPYQMDVNFWGTTGQTLVAGEGVKLTDLGANELAASGIPIITKRANNYDAVYGVRKFSLLKGVAAVGDNVVIALKGDVLVFKASGAIARGEKVALIVSTPGSVRTVTTGYAEVGVALDKADNGSLIRVELTCDNTAVAAT